MAAKVAMEDYIKGIDIVEADINLDQSEFPTAAYLCLELKNNTDKNISELTFGINYYEAEGYMIKKVTVKNKLIEILPKGESRRYKIRLKGDVVNMENEEYPFSKQNKVSEFDIKITGIKFASK
jgi:hypothetical protein